MGILKFSDERQTNQIWPFWMCVCVCVLGAAPDTASQRKLQSNMLSSEVDSSSFKRTVFDRGQNATGWIGKPEKFSRWIICSRIKGEWSETFHGTQDAFVVSQALRGCCDLAHGILQTSGASEMCGIALSVKPAQCKCHWHDSVSASTQNKDKETTRPKMRKSTSVCVFFGGEYQFWGILEQHFQSRIGAALRVEFRNVIDLVSLFLA